MRQFFHQLFGRRQPSSSSSVFLVWQRHSLSWRSTHTWSLYFFRRKSLLVGYTTTWNQHANKPRNMERMGRRTFSDFWRSDSKTWWATPPPPLFTFNTVFMSLASGLYLFVEILLFGTGRKLIQPPPFIQAYLGTLGIQLDVMDTVCTSLPTSTLHTSYLISIFWQIEKCVFNI